MSARSITKACHRLTLNHQANSGTSVNTSPPSNPMACATRRATLWGTLRSVFRIRGFLAAQQVRIGDVVSLDFARYSLAGGVLARVIGIRESVTSNAVELEVFL